MDITEKQNPWSFKNSRLYFKQVEGFKFYDFSYLNFNHWGCKGKFHTTKFRKTNDFGCEKIFSDKISGKNFERTEYKKMKGMLRFQDTLVIQSLSRLGRTKKGILEEWKDLIDKEIDIVVLDMPIFPY